jgi:hypothetical protein
LPRGIFIDGDLQIGERLASRIVDHLAPESIAFRGLRGGANRGYAKHKQDYRTAPHADDCSTIGRRLARSLLSVSLAAVRFEKMLKRLLGGASSSGQSA